MHLCFYDTRKIEKSNIKNRTQDTENRIQNSKVIKYLKVVANCDNIAILYFLEMYLIMKIAASFGLAMTALSTQNAER